MSDATADVLNFNLPEYHDKTVWTLNQLVKRSFSTTLILCASFSHDLKLTVNSGFNSCKCLDLCSYMFRDLK